MASLYFALRATLFIVPKLDLLWSTPGQAKEHRSDQVFRDVILLNAADSKGIAPAVLRAKSAGATV